MNERNGRQREAMRVQPSLLSAHSKHNMICSLNSFGRPSSEGISNLLWLWVDITEHTISCSDCALLECMPSVRAVQCWAPTQLGRTRRALGIHWELRKRYQTCYRIEYFSDNSIRNEMLFDSALDSTVDQTCNQTQSKPNSSLNI